MDLKRNSKEQECACPADSRIARHFDAKVAERLANRQDPGLIAVSERLRDALVSLDANGKTVLELGCGRGGLLLGLVQAGAARATGVDLSSAGIDAARSRFEQAQLSDLAVTHSWGGLVDISLNLAPDFGRVRDNVYYLQGFSGHGLALSGMAGRLVAEAIAGQAERFDVFARLGHRRFPGGKWIRTPALALAILYYRMLDLL